MLLPLPKPKRMANRTIKGVEVAAGSHSASMLMRHSIRVRIIVLNRPILSAM